MNSDENHSQQGETKQSTTATTTTTTTSTRLGFNTAPAVVPSQESNEHVTTNSLRSASAPRTKLEWCWVRVQMNGATFGTKVTYVHPLNKEHVVVVDMKTSPSYFLQPEFIPKENRDQTICSNVRGDLKNHWLMIYACLDLSYAERLEMRCMCRVFREVEKIVALDHHRYEMLMPIPTYTWFPHRNYSTLNELVDKLNEDHTALYGGWAKCSSADVLSVGTLVRVRFVNNAGKKLKTFYPGKITQINNDDNDDNETTFDIVYDDGNTRKNVPLNEIQRRTVSV